MRYRQGFHWAFGEARDQNQHGRQRKLQRQPVYRETLADSKI